MLKIDYVEKQKDDNYLICIRDEEVEELKYGRAYLYDSKNDLIKMKTEEDKAVLMASLMLNPIDLIDMINGKITSNRTFNLSMIGTINTFKNMF